MMVALLARWLCNFFTMTDKIIVLSTCATEEEAEKLARALFPALQMEIEKLHSYAVPELLALPVVAGAENYLNWLHSGLRIEEAAAPVAAPEAPAE